jgi:hypothetical protein
MIKQVLLAFLCLVFFSIAIIPVSANTEAVVNRSNNFANENTIILDKGESGQIVLSVSGDKSGISAKSQDTTVASISFKGAKWVNDTITLTVTAKKYGTTIIDLNQKSDYGTYTIHNVLVIVTPNKSNLTDISSIESTEISSVVTKNLSYTKTNLDLNLYYTGYLSDYDDSESVSDVSHFLDKDGQFAFAYKDKKSGKPIAVFTKNGKVSKTVTLNEKIQKFGAAIQDKDGSIYIVSGKIASSKTDPAIYVSKFTENGQLVKSLGVPQQIKYDSPTKEPFYSGNCDVAINNGILSIFYGRLRFDDHQTSKIYDVDLESMTKLDTHRWICCPSFAQRVIPYKTDFIYVQQEKASEGSFKTTIYDTPPYKTTSFDAKFIESFHFWTPGGKTNSRGSLRHMYSELGDLVVTSEDNFALVGTSTPSSSKETTSKPYQLFIQIFKYNKNSPENYTAISQAAPRVGTTGDDGTDEYTDNGVKWLTSSTTTYAANSKIALVDNKLVVLYELYSDDFNNDTGFFLGSYYTVLTEKGEVITPQTLISTVVKLPDNEEIIAEKSGNISFVGNIGNKQVYICNLEV